MKVDYDLVNELPECDIKVVLVPYGGATLSNSGKLSREVSLLSDGMKVHHGYWEN